MLGCLQLSDFAEELGQVNEIKDAQQRRFFHFLPSSRGRIRRTLPDSGSGTLVSALFSVRKKKNPRLNYDLQL